MTKTLLTMSLIAALTAAPVFAQSEEPVADEAADVVEGAEVKAAVPELDMGEDPNAAPAQTGPRTYVQDGFGDWVLQCLEVPEGDDVCQMYQLLKDANGSNVAEVNIFKIKEGGRAVAGGTFIVPLETLLTQKLTVTVDGGAARRYDYSFCSAVGCYARVGFTEEDIQRFKAGAKATISLVPAVAADQKVIVEMSLSGFTSAYKAASTITQ
ncbi:invasion associated locus B family protein [Pelagimonas varians]|uniref:Invasion associated locus B (IalB) protein n=1 Tax=Pelagimonas varians TaxID=696760 RepID=A0A238JQ97_9RHOB|nr:invasion associated locus B family protein [Pelagimonas varians]PYG34734.1 invasion protein IalB [Pelagimonas varians]SMX32633.1 Invasion associated locus B (IalB) protein [Pelagimonas varians]